MWISDMIRGHKLKIIVCVSLFLMNSCVTSQKQTTTELFDPPERIVLNLTDTPFKSQAVTWRTDKRTKSSKAQYVELTDSPNFEKISNTSNASMEKVCVGSRKFVYHYSTVIKNLKPDTAYSYRVGADNNFSEWNQFRTAEKNNGSFKFVFLGDPQNKVKSRCSQIFRAAYKKAPDADFWLFVGDLVNNGDKDDEWDELFYGLGFIPKMTPMILLPGNHEYPDKRYVHGKGFKLTPLWRPHFTLPENGPAGLEESVYFIDYQGVRFVMLNGNEKLEQQVTWLDKVLSDNPQSWTIAAIHQPVYSTGKYRKKKLKKSLFAPVFDKHSVDLVLQGHDHNYSRSYKIKNGQRVEKNEKGTVYIISVCGPKFYTVKKNHKKLMAKTESGKQLFQVINCNSNSLLYEAFDIKGDLYDSFQLNK
jgi:Calcineurin-like phosphoesterase/Purple acid Phosphatase, N-terminal domain